MPNRFHAHLPFSLIDQHFDTISALDIPLEIAVKAHDLDRITPESLQPLAQRIRQLGLKTSVHGPFLDLSPASFDPLIQQATTRRFDQTLDLAECLGAHTIVFHPGYDRWTFSGGPSAWLANSLDFWPPFIERASSFHCRLVMENIFEDTPDNLLQLLKQLDTPWMGHCFDVGHWALFADCSMEEWFDKLGDWMFHMHLHDNHGVDDDHLPIGEGTIDFPKLLDLVRQLPQEPTLTLEAHSPERLRRSLKQARDLFLGPME